MFAIGRIAHLKVQRRAIEDWLAVHSLPGLVGAGKGERGGQGGRGDALICECTLKLQRRANAVWSAVRKLPGFVSLVLASDLSRRANTSGSGPSMCFCSLPLHCTDAHILASTLHGKKPRRGMLMCGSVLPFFFQGSSVTISAPCSAPALGRL